MVPTRSSSVPLERLDGVDRLADDEESGFEVMNFIGIEVIQRNMLI